MTMQRKAARVARQFKPRTYAWDAEQLRQMRQERGLSLTQIAMKFGCDHTTVLWAFHRLGVPTERRLKGPIV